MSEVDRTGSVLSEEDNERIFRSRIVPQQLAGTPQEQPVAVIVSRQTGAGKTTITSLVTRALASRGESVNIALDSCTPHHPMLDELMAADDDGCAEQRRQAHDPGSDLEAGEDGQWTWRS
ncbi:zeta toxin family protein [Streptomyces sp. NPDC048330]|uniref:zeta toxin family protein n=1 Tax=Streptomyces sp. NPDC048330 TaxID=3365533 RepID=UPI0037202C26